MARRKVFMLMLCALATSAIQTQAASVENILAETYSLPTATPDTWQLRYGTYWYVLDGRFLMPMPGEPTGAISQFYSFGDGNSFLVDQNTQPASGVNYARLEADVNWLLFALAQAAEAKASAQLNAMLGVTDETALMDAGESSGMDSPQYGPTDLWLEVFSVDPSNSQIGLRVHNTTDEHSYQIESKTNLFDTTWTLGPIHQGEFQTNKTDFVPISMLSSNQFFRAHQADDAISITPGPIVIQTNPVIGNALQIGSFSFNHPVTNGAPSSLTVYYHISGTASNGVDYTDINSNQLSGVIALPANGASTNLEILPIPGRTYLNTLTVILTIIPTNTYLVDPSHFSATNLITEPLFAPVVFLNDPVGIDYHTLSNSLIVSCDIDSGLTNTFETIFTTLVSGVTNIVVTNWTGIPSPPNEEIEIATIKRTANGFTNGDMFFGILQPPADARIGWISGTGTNWDLNWSVLPGEALPLSGGLYVDETGGFSNNLIAVSGAPPNASGGNIWQIGPDHQARLLTNITDVALEGVITITNDPAKWGPWAGKIITGDENSGTIFAIATNGEFASFPLDIDCESINLIVTNQNYYACDTQYPWPDHSGQGAILKLPASYFANYVGQLLFTQSEGLEGAPPTLFVVRWDGATTNFVISASFSYTRPDGSSAHFEHTTFAPIEIPYYKP